MAGVGLLAGIGMAMSAASTAMTVLGSISAGNEENKRAKEEARQRETIAKTERAAGLREAKEERRRARLAQSQGLARAAGRGGALDPTTDAVLDRLAGEGEFNALTAMAEAEDRANNQEHAAAVRRQEGKSAKRQGRFNAAFGAVSGVASFAGKYGGQMGGGAGIAQPYHHSTYQPHPF